MKKLLFLIILLPLNSIAQCPEGFVTSQNNLVVNGDFSQGNTGFETNYKYTRKSATEVWLDAAYYTIGTNPQYNHANFKNCSDRSGNNGLMLIANGANVDNQVVWKQTVEVKKNTTYYFSAWLANIVENLSPAKSQFSINGELLGDPLLATDETCNWKQFFTTWYSGESTKAVIEIVNKNLVYNGNDFILDDITFYECVTPNFEQILETATTGQTIELRKIYFETGKHQLKKESYEQLDKLVNYLKSNENMEIEVAGHTDDIGSEKDNQKLSENRAKSVVEYLVSNGINAKRLNQVGYGESQPIDSNDTYEGRQKNRRVEFKIIKM